MIEDRAPAQPILDPLLAMRIGEFIASWSGVQGLLMMVMTDLILGRTTGPDDDLTFVIALVGMEPRIQIAMLKTLLRRRLGEVDAAPLDRVLDRIYKIKRVRDSVAHSIWEKDLKTGRMFAVSLKSTHPARHVRTHFSPARVQEFIAGLRRYTDELVHAVQAHGYLSTLTPLNGRYF